KFLISSIPYLSIAIRSGPIPNANPLYIFGSYPAIDSTSGCTIPAPKISIQPDCLQTEHPDPEQTLQDISISTDGSVKGKKLGRKRISRSLPKIAFANVSKVPFKSLIRTSLSTYNPSICVNGCEWVASSLSRRYTLPGQIIRTGPSPPNALIVRACTGEVCVLNNSSSVK